ncbi:hypothetical protein VSDG_02110 [Cytospora chrysosperma]|uniref:N-acetyltransferase domain-containing protein n=1 Tax=Cytospora chrysosperma TaxID=252740 RepID=A0A423WE63_CYTCH|nr:hypothetical protein VSDG_02110 [Valsa sordida]
MASATTNHSEPPPSQPSVLLILPRVIIRPFKPTDAPSLARHGNDPEIAKNMRDTFPHPYRLQDAEYFLANLASATSSSAPSLRPDGVLLHYALCLPPPSSSSSPPSGGGAGGGGGEEEEEEEEDCAACIGAIGLKPLGDVEARTLELGYWVGRAHWGNGYATEAVAGFSRWAFETFPDVLRLEARVHEGNGASGAVLLKAGYREEGVRRKAVWKNGSSLDMLFYGMLRGECPGLQRTA